MIWDTWFDAGRLEHLYVKYWSCSANDVQIVQSHVLLVLTVQRYGRVVLIVGEIFGMLKATCCLILPHNRCEVSATYIDSYWQEYLLTVRIFCLVCTLRCLIAGGSQSALGLDILLQLNCRGVPISGGSDILLNDHLFVKISFQSCSPH